MNFGSPQAVAQEFERIVPISAFDGAARTLRRMALVMAGWAFAAPGLLAVAGETPDVAGRPWIPIAAIGIGYWAFGTLSVAGSVVDVQVATTPRRRSAITGAAALAVFGALSLAAGLVGWSIDLAAELPAAWFLGLGLAVAAASGLALRATRLILDVTARPAPAAETDSEGRSPAVAAVLFGRWEVLDRPRRRDTPDGHRAVVARYFKRHPWLFVTASGGCVLLQLPVALMPYTDGRGGVIWLAFACTWPAIALIQRRENRRRETVDA